MATETQMLSLTSSAVPRKREEKREPKGYQSLVSIQFTLQTGRVVGKGECC